MIDSNKRKTLKMLGAGGVLASTASVAHSVWAGRGLTEQALEILLVDSADFGITTMILTNLTAEELTISDFAPGTICYDDKFVSLNDAPFTRKNAKNEIVIPASYSMSAVVQSVGLSDVKSKNYLWAQSSVSSVGSWTRVVNLTASYVGQSAIVFAADKAAYQFA